MKMTSSFSENGRFFSKIYIHKKKPAPHFYFETRNAHVSTKYKPFGKSIVPVSFAIVMSRHKYIYGKHLDTAISQMAS